MGCVESNFALAKGRVELRDTDKIKASLSRRGWGNETKEASVRVPNGLSCEQDSIWKGMLHILPKELHLS